MRLTLVVMLVMVMSAPAEEWVHSDLEVFTYVVDGSVAGFVTVSETEVKVFVRLRDDAFLVEEVYEMVTTFEIGKDGAKKGCVILGMTLVKLLRDRH